MKKNLILLSFALIAVPAFAAQQQKDTNIEAKKAAEAANGVNAASTNILQVIARSQAAYVQQAAKDAQFQQMVDKEDAEDLFGQAKVLVPLLAAHVDTKKFIGDLDALIPQIEALANQVPDFIVACSAIKPATKFVRDFMKIVALMQFKANMMGVASQGNGQINMAQMSLMMQLLQSQKDAQKKGDDPKL